jgi:hypothetical protein
MPHEQSGRESPENPAEQIAQADDWISLKAILESLGGLQGETKFYTANELRDLVTLARVGEKQVRSIPDIAGLRAKVEQLIAKDKESK